MYAHIIDGTLAACLRTPSMFIKAHTRHAVYLNTDHASANLTFLQASQFVSSADALAIDHLPVPQINSPGGADTASGEYTELRSVA